MEKTTLFGGIVERFTFASVNDTPQCRDIAQLVNVPEEAWTLVGCIAHCGGGGGASRYAARMNAVDLRAFGQALIDAADRLEAAVVELDFPDA